ncbi:hypothetical protein [Variovorax sp. WDL1]|uniref:hypothetical protein n=2 Tax=Variovorax TaxID=34072 RepID=UPI0012EE05F7|nr:hypothetical protein [Variovorax sp. WDL1]
MPRNTSMSLPAIRRNNTLVLFGEFVAEQALQGVKPLGMAELFAKKLQISASMWTQIRSEKTQRNISDKLARQIETACGKPAKWLDEDQTTEPEVDHGEERFIELARLAYRSQNARGKRALRTLILEQTKPPEA